MVRHLFGLENFGSTGLQQPLSVESLQKTEKKKKKKNSRCNKIKKKNNKRSNIIKSSSKNDIRLIGRDNELHSDSLLQARDCAAYSSKSTQITGRVRSFLSWHLVASLTTFRLVPISRGPPHRTQHCIGLSHLCGKQH